jgi:hypothetical protein
MVKALLEAPDQIEKVLQRQVGVQAADNVELGHRLGVAGGRCLPGLFQRHGVAGRIALLAAEGAQPAVGHANVGGIDVAIDVEVGHIAVHPLAHMVGQPAHRQYIGGAVEHQTLVEVEPLASQHLGGNRLKARVVALKGVALKAGSLAGIRCFSLHNTIIPKQGEANHLWLVSVPLPRGSTSTPS